VALKTSRKPDGKAAAQLVRQGCSLPKKKKGTAALFCKSLRRAVLIESVRSLTVFGHHLVPWCLGCLAMGGGISGTGVFLAMSLSELSPQALPGPGFAAILPTAPGYHAALAPLFHRL